MIAAAVDPLLSVCIVVVIGQKMFDVAVQQLVVAEEGN